MNTEFVANCGNCANRRPDCIYPDKLGICTIKGCTQHGKEVWHTDGIQCACWMETKPAPAGAKEEDGIEHD